MEDAQMGRLTANATRRTQLVAQSTVPVDIQVISHETTIAEQTETSAFLPIRQDLVAVVSPLCILDGLLVVLPEALDPAGTFMLVSHIVAEGSLNTSGHVVPVSIPHRF